MNPLAQTLLVVLIFCLAFVGYTYLAYPVLIWALSRLFGWSDQRPGVSSKDLPSLSLIVAAYNEDRCIRERIKNALAGDYPPERLEVIVASDCSDDRTDDIVREFADRRVRLMTFPNRRGKAAVLNDAIPTARGEIVMLSDANTVTNPQAARQLASWFADPKVGAVCGRLVLTDPVASRNVDGLYWKYETFLKKCESRLGALLGSNGGIYAIRKSAFVPIPNNTVVDDFVIPLSARQKTGCRIIYDRDAVACEETPDSMLSEFHRRARIGAGGFQSIGMLRSLLHPRHGWVAFTFLSHKVLRWVCPFFLAIALLASAGLVVATADGPDWHRQVAQGSLLGQAVFYALALMGNLIPSRPKFLRVFRLPAMFTLMNAALAVGFYRWLTSRQNAAWKRTDRTDTATSETSTYLEDFDSDVGSASAIAEKAS